MKMLISLVLMLAGMSVFSQGPASQPGSGIIKDGFIYETASFPSCHAATLEETPEGLVAAWFGGTHEGNSDVCIYMSRLVKGGWTAPVMIADGRINDSTRYACYNPVLYQVPGKELILFYKIGPNVAGWTGWIKRSYDGGMSWSRPEAIPEGFLGPIRNKPVLRDGWLICPSSTEKFGWKVHFEFTKDGGRTWSKTGPLNNGTTMTGIQPAILFHPGETMQALCRSQDGQLNETWSYDHGRTWTDLRATGLPNNNSGIDAITLKSGMHLLVFNHVKSGKGVWGPRSPLNLALSSDGRVWYTSLELAREEGAEFSYPTIMQTKDGMVHLLYTWKRQRIRHMVIDPSKLRQTTEVVL